MSKRRSSTRLPRRPTPTSSSASESADARSPQPLVTHAPAVVEGRIIRGVRAGIDVYYLEEWNGLHWLPSELPMHQMTSAPLATPELLRQHGVPATDWYVTDVRAASPTSISILRDELLQSARNRA